MRTSSRFSVRFSIETCVELQSVARKRQISVSELIRDLVERSLAGGDSLTKADLEGLLTKADLVKLRTFFTTVIASNKITVTAMKPTQKLLDDAMASASEMTDEMLGQPGTKKAEAKS